LHNLAGEVGDERQGGAPRPSVHERDRNGLVAADTDTSVEDGVACQQVAFPSASADGRAGVTSARAAPL
jgi:hypothetical protein